MKHEISHPDLDWARAAVEAARGTGMRIHNEELDTIRWDESRQEYRMDWSITVLSISLDGVLDLVPADEVQA